ncbi:MAG: O-antigen ligase family protein [Verrucomicrobiota bacterium JB022]|nr:O-antigen ligase family protein [Verrucomicrobiota bacterium JB022]
MIDGRWRRIWASVGLLLGGGFLGVQVASGGWLWALALPFGLALYTLQRARPVSFEGLILAVLVFGYIAGNRGFAQLNLGGVFVGEMALVVMALLGLRFLAQRQSLPYRFDTVGMGILLLMIIGVARLALGDLRQYGVLALRDFALVYYAGFFFLCQPVARHPESRRLVELSLLLGCVALVPGYLLFTQFREFFVNEVRVAGIPFIFYKGDLVACYFGGAFVFFYHAFRQSRQHLWLLLALLSCLLMLHTTNRAAIPGFVFCLWLLYLAGERRAPWITASGALLLALPVVWLSFAAADDFRQTRVWSVYEHTLSLVDVGGDFHYTNRDARSSGDNNRFRLVWWETVLRETTQHAPITGLGFGYSLSSAFVEAYYHSELDNFTARSPHSVILTIYGRMGLLGLAAFGVICWGMLRGTWRSVRLSRAQGSLHPTLRYWCWCWMLLSGAAFGVVLEGPMGAVLFWSILAFATEGTREAEAMALESTNGSS